MFLLYPSYLQNFKNIKNQLLCHQINIKISSFCNLKLCIQNKFIDHIVNKIWFERNLICMLRTKGTWNSMVRFSKFTLKKEINDKFEKFLSKLVWRETLFFHQRQEDCMLMCGLLAKTPTIGRTHWSSNQIGLLAKRSTSWVWEDNIFICCHLGVEEEGALELPSHYRFFRQPLLLWFSALNGR